MPSSDWWDDYAAHWGRSGVQAPLDPPDVDPAQWEEERRWHYSGERRKAREMKHNTYCEHLSTWGKCPRPDCESNETEPSLRERLIKGRREGRNCWHLKRPDNCMWCDDINETEKTR